MTIRRSRTRLLAAGAAVGLTAVALAGCSSSSNVGATGGTGASSATSSSRTTGSSSPTSSGDPSTSDPASGGFGTPDARVARHGRALCDLIEPQLSQWRVNGPTLSTPALNASVLDWASRSGIELLWLGSNRGQVDAAMHASCASVHQETLRTLSTSRLADRLVGLG